MQGSRFKRDPLELVDASCGAGPASTNVVQSASLDPMTHAPRGHLVVLVSDNKTGNFRLSAMIRTYVDLKAEAPSAVQTPECLREPYPVSALEGTARAPSEIGRAADAGVASPPNRTRLSAATPPSRCLR